MDHANKDDMRPAREIFANRMNADNADKNAATRMKSRFVAPPAARIVRTFRKSAARRSNMPDACCAIAGQGDGRSA